MKNIAIIYPLVAYILFVLALVRQTLNHILVHFENVVNLHYECFCMFYFLHLIAFVLHIKQARPQMSLPAILLAKESINRSYESSLNEGLLFERRMFHSSFALEDQKEGMSAFIEKRQPSFKNR